MRTSKFDRTENKTKQWIQSVRHIIYVMKRPRGLQWIIHSRSYCPSSLICLYIDIHTNSQMCVRAHITLTQIGTHTTRMYSQYSVHICEWQDIYRFGSKYSCLIFPSGFELIKPTVNIVWISSKLSLLFNAMCFSCPEPNRNDSSICFYEMGSSRYS